MRQVNSEWFADLMAWIGKCKDTRNSYLLLWNPEVQFLQDGKNTLDKTIPSLG